MYKLSRAPPARQAGAGGHLAVLPPGRQDRRARAERLGQVDPAAHHGRAGHRLPRRRPARARRHRRAARAGAAARPDKDVRGNVEDGVRELRDMLDRFNELAANYSDETADEFARLQDRDRRRRRLEPRHHARDRHGRAAPAARRRRRGHPLRAASGAASRSAGCCWPRPTCCCSTSRPTTSTPSRSPGSRSTSRTTRARSWRSPTTATSSTTWPAGSSSSTAAAASPSRATTRPGSSRSRRGWRRRSAQETARRRTIARELEWVRESPQGPAHQGARPASTATRRCSPRSSSVKLDQVQIHIPAGPRLGDVVLETERRAQGLRRPPADRGPLLQLPPAGIVGVIGAERRRQDDAVPHDRRRGGARRRRRCALGDSVELAYVDQSRDALDPDKTVWEEISDGYDQIKVGDREMNSRAYAAGFNFRGLRPAAQGRRAVGRRAQPRAPRQAAAPRRQPAAARRADQRPRRGHAARARGGAARRSPAAR